MIGCGRLPITLKDGHFSSFVKGLCTNRIWGGGLTNSSGGTVDLIGDTFSNNTADYGGAIYSGNISVPGSITNLTNSTVSGNTGNYEGGGIYVLNGSVYIINSTLSGNGSPSGGALKKYSPGIIVQFKNTIAANSTTGANCAGSVLNGGGNLQYGGTNPTSCHIGIPVGDPKLAALANNGGPTQTMALAPGSAAIDTGDDTICAAAPVNNRDQRSVTRPQGAHCDIGAYEYGGFVPTNFLYLPLILR